MLTADPPTGDVGEDAGLESRGVADVVSDKLEQSLPVAANNGRSCSPALATRVTPGGLAGAAEGEHNNPNSDSAAAGNAHIAGLGPSEEPISANLNARDSAPMVKKPRKKAVSFDDTARIRFLRYRTEKRQQHAEIQSSMTIKALFDRVAEEFCGTLFPEYDFSGSELSNLERSLRRTFVAYDEKGYDSDKTVKLAGKAPPKDDLWIAMKELFRIEGQKSGSLVDDRPQAPKRDDLSKISTVLQQHNSSTGIESTVLANLPEPSGRAMDLDIEAHEEIAESDEETRWTYRRGDYVDESEDDERIRVQTDLEKRQRWKSVIGAARFGADATTVGRTITNAAKGCAPVGEDKAEPGAVGKGIRPSRGQGPMDRAGTLPSKGTSVSTKLKDAAQADPGGRIKDHFKSPNTNRIPLSKVLVESSDLEDENELLTKVQLVVSTDKNVLKDEAEGIQHQAAADPVKEGVDAEGSLAGQTLPVAKKRGRPRKKLPEGHVEPKTVRASKNAAQAGNEDPKQGDLQDLAEKSTKRRRRALDEPREPKPKRPRAPRKIKSKSAEPAIVISDTEREMATEPPKYRGPFLTDFPTRSVHFLRVTSQHLMQVILYLRKKNLDAWWSEERFQEVMLSLRCELAAKLEKEFKAKTKGLADIHRSVNFAMSYFLTSNEVDHSFLVLPDSNAEHYTPFYVYPQSICVYVEPPRPIGLPDFWGVKFAKQPPPPKPAKKPRVKRKKDAGEDGHADDAVENAEDSRRTKQKQQVLLTDVVLGKKDEAKRPLKPVSDMIFEINSDDNGQVPVKTLLAGDSVQLVEVDAVLEAAGKAD